MSKDDFYIDGKNDFYIKLRDNINEIEKKYFQKFNVMSRHDSFDVKIMIINLCSDINYLLIDSIFCSEGIC